MYIYTCIYVYIYTHTHSPFSRLWCCRRDEARIKKEQQLRHSVGTSQQLYVSTVHDNGHVEHPGHNTGRIVSNAANLAGLSSKTSPVVNSKLRAPEVEEPERAAYLNLPFLRSGRSLSMTLGFNCRGGFL